MFALRRLIMLREFFVHDSRPDLQFFNWRLSWFARPFVEASERWLRLIAWLIRQRQPSLLAMARKRRLHGEESIRAMTCAQSVVCCVVAWCDRYSIKDAARSEREKAEDNDAEPIQTETWCERQECKCAALDTTRDASAPQVESHTITSENQTRETCTRKEENVYSDLRPHDARGSDITGPRLQQRRRWTVGRDERRGAASPRDQRDSRRSRPSSYVSFSSKTWRWTRELWLEKNVNQRYYVNVPSITRGKKPNNNKDWLCNLEFD